MALVPDHELAITLLVAGFVCFGLTTSCHWTISQTMAGPLAAGKWTAMQNAIGSMAGVIAPAATGLIVQETGSFHLAFVSFCAVLVTGALGYAFVVGRGVRIFAQRPNWRGASCRARDAYGPADPGERLLQQVFGAIVVGSTRALRRNSASWRLVLPMTIDDWPPRSLRSLRRA